MFSGIIVPRCDVAKVSTENASEPGCLFTLDFYEARRNPSTTGTIIISVGSLFMNGLSSLAIPSIYRGVLGTHLTCCPLNIDILRFLAACALWEKFMPGEFARPLKPKPGEFARPDIPAGLEPLWSAQPLIFISSSMPIDPYSLLSTSFSELASSTPKLAGVMIMELSLASQSSNSYSTTLNCFYCSNFCRSRAKVWASYLAAKFISFIRIAVFSRKTCKAGISRWNCLRKVSSTFSLSSACPTLILLFSFWI